MFTWNLSPPWPRSWRPVRLGGAAAAGQAAGPLGKVLRHVWSRPESQVWVFCGFQALKMEIKGNLPPPWPRSWSPAPLGGAAAAGQAAGPLGEVLRRAWSLPEWQVWVFCGA